MDYWSAESLCGIIKVYCIEHKNAQEGASDDRDEFHIIRDPFSFGIYCCPRAPRAVALPRVAGCRRLRTYVACRMDWRLARVAGPGPLEPDEGRLYHPCAGGRICGCVCSGGNHQGFGCHYDYIAPRCHGPKGKCRWIGNEESKLVTYSVPSTERLLNAKHFSRLPPKSVARQEALWQDTLREGSVRALCQGREYNSSGLTCHLKEAVRARNS